MARKPPPIEKLSISLDVEMSERVDEWAERCGISRSSVIETALERFFDQKAAAIAKILDERGTRRRF